MSWGGNRCLLLGGRPSRFFSPDLTAEFMRESNFSMRDVDRAWVSISPRPGGSSSSLETSMLP